MKRTTVFLDETLERDLQAIARQEKRPVASLVREALATYVANREPTSAPALSFVGVGPQDFYGTIVGGKVRYRRESTP